MLNNLNIKTRIIVVVLSIAVIFSAGIGVFAYIESSQAILNLLENTLVMLSEQGANQVVSKIDIEKVTLEGIANRNVIRSMNWQDQKQVLISEVNRTTFIGLGIVDLDGNVKFPDESTTNIFSREYFQKAIKGETVISSVLIDKILNKAIIAVATPIRAENNQIIGVLFGRLPGDLLTDVTNNLYYGSKGYSYIIDDKGTIISHKDHNLIMNQTNYIEESKTNQELIPLASILRTMTSGQQGFGGYPYQGSLRHMGYSPIPGTGWSIALGSFEDEIMAPILKMRNIFISIIVFAVILGTLIAYYMGNSIAKPINLVNASLEDISQGEGDLTKRIAVTSNDEIGQLAKAFNLFMDKLHDMIANVKQNALHIASSTEQIGAAMNQVAQTVEEQASTTEEISASVMEISANSEEVSGNSEQASANVTQISQTVQNLQTGIQYLGEQFTVLNGKSQHVYDSTQKGVEWLEESNSIISQMVDSSKIISERIESVNDVAEQIKLLALNAAIVAAQAGEHGKGFSVVADAINALAQQAGKTADEITSTVRTNVEIAQKGLDVSQKTLNMMHEIAESSNESKNIAENVNERVQEQVISGNEIAVAAGDSAERVHQVSVAMGEQTNAVNQVTEALEQLASMATETAASVEQVSSSNQELLHVAEGLREMVEKFKLDNQNTSSNGLQLR